MRRLPEVNCSFLDVSCRSVSGRLRAHCSMAADSSRDGTGIVLEGIDRDSDAPGAAAGFYLDAFFSFSLVFVFMAQLRFTLKE